MITKIPFRLLVLLVMVPQFPGETRSQQVAGLKLVKGTDGWRFLQGDTTVPIRGVGGDASFARLKALGGNCIRTWGVNDRTDGTLQAARDQGLGVAFGIWLGHERHGFDYTDFKQVQKQTEQVRQAVQKYRSHPEIWMWCLGNEMEGYEAGDNPAIWSHIESLARMVKQLDPDRPVMTIIAEVGGNRIPAIHDLCPSIDVVGINSYGGAPTIPTRYREAGGTKPYLVTEFGPPGVWEMKKDDDGMVHELTSTEKARFYRDTYTALSSDRELCLGCFAFYWGTKEEATSTWYGMVLPTGELLAAAETMATMWTGKEPTNRCPVIEGLRWGESGTVRNGDELVANLTVTDPDGDPLRVDWVLAEDGMNYALGGDRQEAGERFDESILEGDLQSARIRAPRYGGSYRLYAYIYDDHEHAAVANIPLQVDGPRRFISGEPVELPYRIGGEQEDHFFAPTGWMGNKEDLSLDSACTESPHEGTHCIEMQFRRNDGWGGIVWQHPHRDWGKQPGGVDLTGAKRLTFWARGDAGGERIGVEMGILGRDTRYFDTTKAKSEYTLTRMWQQYVLELPDGDFRRIKTPFVVTLAGQGKPLRIFLDEIRYE